MKFRTTLQLASAVLILGGVIWVIDHKIEKRDGTLALGKPLFGQELDHVEYLFIERDGMRIDCRRENGRWLIKTPLEARADKAQINRVLATLETLTREEIVTAEELALRQLRPADYGLERPRMRIRFGNAGQHHELLVGDAAPPGNHVYVKLAWSGDVVVVSDALLTAVPARVDDLRDRALLDGAPARVVKLEIHRYAAGYVQMFKQDGVWNIQQPFVARADADVVERLLNSLYAAVARFFVWDPLVLQKGAVSEAGGTVEPGPRAETYGLAPDEVAARVSIWLRGDDVGRVLMLGKENPERDGEIYARLSGSASVFTVSRALLDEFMLPVVELRDRRLFALNFAKIRYASFESDGTRVQLERNDLAGWRITEPLQRLADERVVSLMLKELIRVKAAAFADDEEADAALRALESSADMVCLEEQNPVREVPEAAPAGPAGGPRAIPPRRRLRIGKTADESGSIHAAFEGEDTVFRLPADTFTRLGIFPLDPMLFLDRTVLSAMPETVRRISLKKNGVEQSASRDENGPWKLERPDQAELDGKALEALLFLLADLRALRIVSYTAADLALYGLDDPMVTVTLGLSGESGIQKSLMLGYRARTEGLYAMVQGQDVVFILAADVVEALTADIVAGADPTDQ